MAKTAIYASAKSAILAGTLNLLAAGIKVMAISGAYTPDFATHQYLSDVPAPSRVTAGIALASKTLVQVGTAVKFDANDVTFPSVTGSAIEGLVMYEDTGVAGTSKLIGFFSYFALLPITPTGANITFRWPDYAIFVLDDGVLGGPQGLPGTVGSIPDPVNGVLAKQTDTTVRTATNVYLTPGGKLVAASNPANAPTTGNINGADDFTLHTKVGSEQKIGIQSASNGVLAIGGTYGAGKRSQLYKNSILYSQYDSGCYVQRVADDGQTGAGLAAVGPYDSPITAGFGEYFCYLAPNAHFGWFPAGQPYKPFNGGVGIVKFDRIVTNPTAAPDIGHYYRSNHDNHHPEILLPGDDPDTGWRDLLGGGAGNKFFKVGATPSSGVLDVATLDAGLGEANWFVGTATLDGGYQEIHRVTGLHDLGDGEDRKLAIEFPDGGYISRNTGGGGSTAGDILTPTTRYFEPGEWCLLTTWSTQSTDGGPVDCWGVIGGRDQPLTPFSNAYGIDMANANQNVSSNPDVMAADTLFVFSSVAMTANRTLTLPDVTEGSPTTSGPGAAKNWNVISAWVEDFKVTLQNGAGAPNTVALGCNNPSGDDNLKRGVSILSTTVGIHCVGFSTRATDASKTGPDIP